MCKTDTVFVVIVTYNGINDIDKCLSSVYSSDIPVRVLVIDNASKDNTVEFVSKKYPDVELMKSYINYGFGKGNNIGIKYAYECGAKYVFLLNQDAWVKCDTIRILKEKIDANKDCGIISPLHYNGKCNRLDKKFATHLSKSKSIGDVLSDCLIQKKKEFYFIDYANAAAWLLSRDCIETVGLFNPVFSHYGEDWEYLHRLAQKGYKVGLSTKSVIFHNRNQNKNEDLLSDKEKLMHYEAYIKYKLSRCTPGFLVNNLSVMYYVLTRKGIKIKFSLFWKIIYSYVSVISCKNKGYKKNKAFFEMTDDFISNKKNK